MDRKEKIYEELKSYSGSGEAEGLDAQQLAELTGIDRANVSRKLNELEREGRVIKLSGRPVRYMEREVYDKCQEKEKKTFLFLYDWTGGFPEKTDRASKSSHFVSTKRTSDAFPWTYRYRKNNACGTNL